MAQIHVCPLSRVGTVLDASGARSIVSLLALDHRVPRFTVVPDQRHLHLALSDIVVETRDFVLPQGNHVERLLAFVEAWDRRAPLLIHCYAGVSRSTAASFIALCALHPGRTEAEHAAVLRRAAPTATPNLRLVTLADAVLGRDGRMVAAIEAIGRGADCFEGVCFALDVPDAVEAGARPAEMV